MQPQPSKAAIIGKQLVDLCNEGKNIEAVKTLYAKDVVSVEAMAMPPMEQTLTGIDKVLGKSEWWFANHEVHSSKAEGPYPHGDDRFAVIFDIDVTPKAGPMSGQRMAMRELGVYTLKNDKIVKEEFYYGMG